MKIKNICLLIVLILSLSINAQLPLLPDLTKEITQNANIIVRKSETFFNVLSESDAKEKRVLIVTVMNPKGLSHVDFVETCDKWTDLTIFSCEVYDIFGKRVRKYKKTDLTRTEYSTSGIASDAYSYYMNAPTGLSFPFTIKYEWETYYKNCLVAYPAMRVMDSYNASVQDVKYTLSVPETIEFAYKPVNFEPKITTKEEKGKKIYEFSASSFNAIEKELFSSSDSIIKLIHFRPETFKVDKYSGSLKTWESFGSWIYQLYEGRDLLPANIKDKVKELTSSCTDEREKVKVLYEFLGENTRYVSIQLGIGGWQPMTVAEVVKTGFGDCKALTNYMFALLKEAGISSYPTIIYSGYKKEILKDFPSFSQFNHVILQVPFQNDTIWLECTNPTLPFGYIHNDIAGHEALAITSEGGKVVTLPDYPSLSNRDIYNATINLFNDATASAEIKGVYSINNFDSNFKNNKLPENKQKDIIAGYIDVNNPKVHKVDFKNDNQPLPKLSFDALVDLGRYGTITGNRIFIQTNIMRSGFNKFNKRKERIQPICFNYEFIDADTIRIKLNDNLKVESLPERNVMIDSEFGKFESEISFDEENETIIIIQTMDIKKGTYPKDKYIEMCNFFEAISDHYNAKIILKKE